MRRLVPLLVASAAALLPAPPAWAAACADVSDVRGTNPSLAETAQLLEAAAARHDVPPSVLKSLAWVEGYDAQSDSRWRQFRADGSPVVSADCGIGLLQVTDPARPLEEQRRLAADVAHNADQGAAVLAEKFAAYARTRPAAVPEPDRSLVENWYVPVRLFNGSTAPRSYPELAALRVALPPAHMDGPYPAYAPGQPWTLPQAALPGWAHPQNVAAAADGRWWRWDTSGTVLGTGRGSVHSWRGRPLRLDPPSPTVVGPELSNGGFSVAGRDDRWRSAAPAGLAGRALWTGSNGPDVRSNTAAWRIPAAAGRWLVEAYVPTLSADGVAVYATGPSTAAEVPLGRVDQAAHRGRWAAVGVVDHPGGELRVASGDRSPSPLGTPLAMDALRLTAVGAAATVARVTLASSSTRVTYGNRPVLSGSVTDPGGRGIGGQTVDIVAAVYGGEGSQPVATVVTASNGTFSLPVQPTAQTDYRAGAENVASPVVRVAVNTRLDITGPVADAQVASPVTVTGRLQPARAGRAVGLAYIGPGGRYAFLGQGATAADGSFEVTGRPPAGTWTFVLYTSASAGTDRGARSVRLTVA